LTTDAPSTRSVTGADDVARRVHDQPGGLVEGADDVAGGVDHVAGGRIERADDVAGGVHDDRAVHGRGGGGIGGGGVGGVGRTQQGRVVRACGVGRRRRRAIGRRRGSGIGRRRVGAGDGVGLVDRAVLDAGRDRVGGDVLVDHDTLVGQRLRAGTVGEDVGRHGTGDRRHDVGVQGDGEVDGSGTVDGEVDIGREVEDRDDFLVR
jgi:hypothetical protein